MDINAKKQKRKELVAQARGLMTVAETATRAMTSEEEQSFDRLMEEADTLERDIERDEKLRKLERDDPAPPIVDDKKELTDEERQKRAFREYLQTGQIREEDVRALNMGHDPEGGYLVAPQEFVEQLLKKVDDLVVIRQLATGLTLTKGESLGVPTLEVDLNDADWTSEIETGNDDDALRFGKRELRPHPLAKRVKISKTLIRRSSLDPELLVQDRMAYKFGVTKEKAYMVGDGNQKPLGLFTVAADGVSGITTGRDVNIGAAGAIPATVATGDQIIDAKYTLKAAYHRNARWLFHRLIIRQVRKLKDNNGQYIWQPGLQRDQPDTILELPFVLSEFAPSAIGANAYIGMLGDFSYYWYVDALDLEVQRLVELYAEQNRIGFIGRHESDGMPVLEEAFVRLKVPA